MFDFKLVTFFFPLPDFKLFRRSPANYRSEWCYWHH